MEIRLKSKPMKVRELRKLIEEDRLLESVAEVYIGD